ncbi:CHC2 zinc finger domain-containing protein [Sphingobacterium siyangense]|uniref:CHC2 zinc finger domain-containing protein n=1 Tax=Sphingobacterium siyangense TaxID=459529 RepID=UPI003DA5FC64
MNIEHAKSIHLSEILEKIGFSVQKVTERDFWYLSPFRKENTPSLHVQRHKNVWYDFGEGRGGDNIAFVQAYLAFTNENSTVSDALRWLKNMFDEPGIIQKIYVPDHEQEDSKLTLKDIKPIKHTALIQYLKSRGIPLEVARRYLHEVIVYHHGNKKTYFSLGFKNEDAGYELRNPYFKGCIRPKEITFIRGTIPKPDGIHIFEGFMDYLSIITQREGKPLYDDSIVLNSLSCMKNASAYIKGYGYTDAYTWLDNDPAGMKATEAFKEFFKIEKNLTHHPMNGRYAPHKDLNAWHMHTLGLKL